MQLHCREFLELVSHDASDGKIQIAIHPSTALLPLHLFQHPIHPPSSPSKSLHSLPSINISQNLGVQYQSKHLKSRFLEMFLHGWLQKDMVETEELEGTRGRIDASLDRLFLDILLQIIHKLTSPFSRSKQKFIESVILPPTVQDQFLDDGENAASKASTPTAAKHQASNPFVSTTLHPSVRSH
jgi:hypothetical protein